MKEPPSWKRKIAYPRTWNKESILLGTWFIGNHNSNEIFFGNPSEWVRERGAEFDGGH